MLRVYVLSSLVAHASVSCFSPGLQGDSGGGDAPTADAGIDASAYINASVQLDASGSTDLEGANLTYLWEQISGTTVTLSDATAVNPTFTAPTSGGTLVFRVTVSDGVHSATATVTITIQGDPTQVGPFADLGLVHISSITTSVTLGATQSQGTYPITNPISAQTVNIANDTTWDTSAGAAIFIRASEIVVDSGSHTISANGANGVTPGGAAGGDGGIGGSGGGGGGAATASGVNAGDGGGSGQSGDDGAQMPQSGTGGTGTLSRDSYAGSFTFPSGGAGGRGGNGEMGGTRGNGGTATNGAGAGGGGGGGALPLNSTGGGGGGGGGGLIVIVAERITGSGTLTLSAQGGNGADSTDAAPGRDSGGGGGGGGGVIYVALSNYTAGQLTFDLSGGGAGNGFDSQDGVAGSSGNYSLCQIVDGTFSLSCGKDPASDSW